LSRRITALFLAVAFALACAPIAQASRSQFTIFQASRELRSPDAGLRAQTLDEIQALGVHWIRAIVYWHDVAPDADSASRPRFDEADPAAYPVAGWAR
jgi:hypothetical protein